MKDFWFSMILFQLEKICRIYARQSALITADDILTYDDLREQVLCRIKDLQRLRLHAGACIALSGSASFAWILNFLSIMHMDIIATPLSTRLTPAQILERLEQIRSEIILADEDVDPHLQTGHPQVYQVPFESRIPAFKALPDLPLTRPATITFTSGSGGAARPILHTFGNHIYNALGAAQNMPLVPGDRWLISLPLHHVGGLAIIFRTLLAGATMVIPHRDQNISESLRRFRITHASLVPTQLRQLLEADADYPHLKTVLIGGAPTPHSTVLRSLESGLPICYSYGSTEMASQIATTSPGNRVSTPGFCGRVLQYRSVKIAPDGEIRVRGLTLSPGHVAGEQILPLVAEDGWFSTGDLGYMDAQGCLTIKGRKDNMFISGGENIYPEEIENVLNQHPYVMESLVVNIPDKIYGSRPVAFLRLRETKKIDQELFRKFLEGKIERFKIPDRFFSWPEDSGELKISRKNFREIALKRII